MASLAQILYPPPTRTGWEEWTFWHQAHHDAIEESMATVLGIQPVKHQLHPFSRIDLQNWLLQHSAAHDRMAQYLSINTQDLSNLDFENKSAFDAWIYENFIEHLGAAQRLGTTIT